MRTLGHGDVAPAARPAEDGLGGLGGVDAVEQRHADEGGDEADEGRGEGEGCVDGNAVADL